MNALNEIKESIGGSSRYDFNNASDSPKIIERVFGGWQAVSDAMNGKGFQGNAATRHGEKYEEIAAEKAQKFFGPCIPQLRLTEGNFAATIDLVSENGDFLIEVKCPYQGKASKIWKAVNDFADPLYYRWQIAHQLMVCPSAKNAFLFVYDAESGEFCFTDQVPHPADSITLNREWGAFHEWRKTGLPDPADGWIENLSDTWACAAQEFRDIERQIKELSLRQDDVRQRLIDLAEGDKVRGNGVQVIKTTRIGNVNYKAIPQLQGIDLEMYRGKPIEVTTVKEMK